MSTSDTSTESECRPDGEWTTSSGWLWLGRVGRLVLVLSILATSAGISFYWLTHRPKAQRRPPQTQATLVEVRPVQHETARVIVHAWGTVIPAKKTQLAARVSGQLVDVNSRFVPGGYFMENEQILQVERKDYELAAEQNKANLTKAESNMKLEMGQQSVARHEYEILGEIAGEEDEELLLRQPQLEATAAAIAVAQASLDKAELDLVRTAVVSPFNAVVQSRHVDLGSYVSPGMALATLIGTDEYWVEVSVPVDELQWISIPGVNNTAGSTARIYHEQAWGSDAFREGKVKRLMTDLEPQGRMARLLVGVDDPLQLHAATEGSHPLILGLSGPVKIDGREIPNVVRAPRTAVRDGDRVWVMDPDSTLAIREIQIVWGGTDYVYISDGLKDGDLLITSDLAVPVQGMALRTADKFPIPSPQDSSKMTAAKQAEDGS